MNPTQEQIDAIAEQVAKEWADHDVDSNIESIVQRAAQLAAEQLSERIKFLEEAGNVLAGHLTVAMGSTKRSKNRLEALSNWRKVAGKAAQ